MNYIVLVIMSLIFILPSENKSIDDKNINKEFVKHVNKFSMLYTKHRLKELPDINIAFTNKLYKNHHGIACRAVNNKLCTKKNTILINEISWNKLSTKQQEILIFHELGHLVLKRRHVYEDVPNQCETSIMTYSALSEDCYRDNYNRYIKELFKKDKKNVVISSIACNRLISGFCNKIDRRIIGNT